ncbi:MAG TPA: hypothetical protein PK280_01295 [Planctomycetota bacterium]|nr:hypothetical protein [Planctomycetota bacterium]
MTAHRLSETLLSVALVAAASGCASRGAAPAPATTAAPARPGGFTTYHNAEKGFSVTFPAGWERRDGLKGATVAAISPAEGPSDRFRENAAVVAEDLPAGTGLEDYARASRARIQAFFRDDNYEEHEFARVRVGPADGFRLVYSHRRNGQPLKLVTWLAVKGSRGFVVCCGAEPGEFDRYLPQFEQIGGSFVAH